MSKKAWRLAHTKIDLENTTLIRYTLTLPISYEENATYVLTIDLNAPPIPYVTMQQWFLDLFQTLWWTERDGRNFLFYNQIVDDFIKIVVKYRNHPDATYPFE